MEIIPLVGIGPVKFGMKPAEVKELLGKKLTWEEWMGGNRNGDLCYPGLVVGFDLAGPVEPLREARVMDFEVRPWSGVTWNGRPLAQFVCSEVMSILTAMDAAPKRHRRNVVDCEKLGLRFEFSDEGSLDYVRMYEPFEVKSPDSPTEDRRTANNRMTATLSKIISCISWLVAAMTLAATLIFFQVAVSQDPFGAEAFFEFVSIGFGSGCLLLALIPSSILFFRSRQREDLRSLCLSGISFLVIVGETAAMYYLAYLKHYPVEKSYF